MTAVAERYYLARMPQERILGIATTRRGDGVPTALIKVVEAGHPVPDEAGLRGAAEALELAHSATKDDLVLVLLSGGGSSNWTAPVSGVSLAQKQALTRALLRSGASIDELNTVRKHLSRIKGGGLARAAYPAKVVTLAFSDVPNDTPDAIASGPTLPDPSSLANARAVISKYDLPLENAVRQALNSNANETPKPSDPVFDRTTFEILASPNVSLRAVQTLVESRGLKCINLGSGIEGEAREVAKAHTAIAIEIAREKRRAVIISGGELTVTVRGKGRGGPNQEYVLSLAIELAGRKGISALAAATDGGDGGATGASEPAGALVDEATLSRAKKAGLDAQKYLENNDATAFFASLGDLFATGPTHTNVNDFRAIIVDSTKKP